MRWHRFLPRRWVFLTATAVALLAALATADFGARRLLDPARTPLDPSFVDLREHPERHGLKLTPFKVMTEDGLTLQALLAQPTGTAPPGSRTLAIKPLLAARGLGFRKNRGTLLLLHGLNGRKEHLLAMASRFSAAGFRCIVFDARAHGQSDGRYCTFGWREAGDARRVLAEASRRFGAPEQVGVLGYSMGGATALRLASQEPAAVDAVAAVAPFAELREVVRRQTPRRWHGVLRPLTPLVRLCVRARAGFDPWSIETVSACQTVSCPLLLVYGAQDQLIPASHTERLAAAASTGPVQRRQIPDATHTNVFIKGGNALYADIVAFFATTAAVARLASAAHNQSRGWLQPRGRGAPVHAMTEVRVHYSDHRVTWRAGPEWSSA
jgi:pimeloyl-ACP methyl ester carboxylesterase